MDYRENGSEKSELHSTRNEAKVNLGGIFSNVQ
jgi:hypothetical protein